ncbi:MAG: DUF6178 family protein [Thermodesulfobacteriota bacterium]
MQHDSFLVPVSEDGRQVLDLVKVDKHRASEIMAALPLEDQVGLVSYQASRDPKRAEDLLFLLDDEKSSEVVDNLEDRTLFRIMKAHSSTHIGVLSLVKPERVQNILDMDPELFSTRGTTDPETAYHWLVSFLEEDEATFGKLLKSIDIKVVASAFQDKVIRPAVKSSEPNEEEEDTIFPADFLVKMDRGELKPDDLEVTDQETLDILTRIYLVDDAYFGEVVSLMLREEDLKARTAEEAFDRIHAQVGDLSGVTDDADDMFVPLDE